MSDLDLSRYRRDERSGLWTARAGQKHPMYLGRVLTATPSPGHFISVMPTGLLGSETEGGAGSAVDVPSGVAQLVYLLASSAAPATGDQVVCTHVNYRWQTQRSHSGRGGGGPPPGFVTIPGCSCSAIPATLYMTSSGTTTIGCPPGSSPCPACYPGDFQACTLQYGPTPSQFSALGLGANCFLSTADFQDPTQTPPFGLFRYTFGCTANFFSLSRVYEPTSSSLAYHDTTIYTWAIGISGNTCSPFLLSNGTIYAGGNPNCLVVISA